MDNFWYLFGALAVVWALVFGYVWHIIGKQNQLRREVEALKEALPATSREKR